MLTDTVQHTDVKEREELVNTKITNDLKQEKNLSHIIMSFKRKLSIQVAFHFTANLSVNLRFPLHYQSELTK